MGSFSGSIPPWFVLSHNIPMINTTTNWLRWHRPKSLDLGLTLVRSSCPGNEFCLGLGLLFLKCSGEFGMVQKRPFSGNTWALSAHPDRSRVGAGVRESLAAVLGLQFRENRVYPSSSSQ